MHAYINSVIVLDIHHKHKEYMKCSLWWLLWGNWVTIEFLRWPNSAHPHRFLETYLFILTTLLYSYIDKQCIQIVNISNNEYHDAVEIVEYDQCQVTTMEVPVLINIEDSITEVAWSYEMFWYLWQYMIRCVITISYKVSNLRDWIIKCSYHLMINF